MKSRLKLFVIAISVAIFLMPSLARADEGMWIPMLINKNYDQMKKLGFKLTEKDIYDINTASLKDAIVSLDFCSGEIVSRDGLMLTNHHCGYGAIQSHSSVKNDYLTDGFWAKNKSEELPSPEINASVLVRIEDVTAKIEVEFASSSYADRIAKQSAFFKKLTDEAVSGTVYTASIKDVFGGNQYLMFVYERYTDVRLVGAPPSSIGKFGGDTDNWMWPRHTGDFSMFRIYMSADGKPAAYSKDNVPYKPKKFLPISLKGVKQGDFAMILGYPGRTNRYAFSGELENAVEKSNPSIIKLLGKKLEIMKGEMDKSAEVRIKLASDYATMSNGYKYYQGQNEGLKRLNVVSYKRNEEAKYNSFVASNKNLKAGNAATVGSANKTLQDYKVNIDRAVYTSLAGLASTAATYPASFKGLLAALKDNKAEDIKTEAEKLKAEVEAHFKDYDATTDEKIFAQLTNLYYSDLSADMRPAYLQEMVNKYRASTSADSFTKYADAAFEKSIFTSKAKMEAFLAKPTFKVLSADPLFVYNQKITEFRASYSKVSTEYSSTLAQQKKAYIAGLMEMNKGLAMYPDANSTMRLTYGTIRDYSPRDAVDFEYTTTGRGILEKMDNTNEEFVVPKRLEELLRKKDFGQYGENGELVISFLSDNDITGGNSGSGVINGNGELIGIAYDGNWEAMTGDLVYDEALKRTISVDIRYVLFVMDKYADAGYLLQEMDIRK